MSFWPISVERPPHELLEMMRQSLAQRKALDALRSPFRADLIARHAPHFFRVTLEERLIQMPAETVDEKILERFLGTDRPDGAGHIAEPALTVRTAPRFRSVARFSFSG